MKTARRYHLFSDYLRNRFGDRLQKVTLSGGLVCPDPEGPAGCGYCKSARAIDPAWGRGAPPHEQIRRGINFSKRNHHPEPHLHVTIPNHQALPPDLEHLEATLVTVSSIPEVSVVSFWTRTEWADDDVAALLARFADDALEVWLELDDAPAAWPATRPGELRYGVQVDLGLGPAPAPANGHTAEAAARLVQQLRPDAVGIKAPAVVAGTDEAELYERGRLTDVELDDFADRAAEFLERIPKDVAVHPLVLNAPGDAIVAPHWVHNRQKVEEAVSLALEARGAVQGGKAE
jgi:radical SAM superfamily enzyme